MSRVVSLGLLAVLALAGGGATVAQLTGDSSPESAAEELPGARTIERGGVTYAISPAPPAGAIAGADGTSVTVFQLQLGHPGDTECVSLEPKAKVAEESATEVRVVAYAYTVNQSVSESSCARADIAPAGPTYAPTELTLQEPLGDRALIDVTTGEAIGMLDPTYAPEPAYVPDGYRQALVTHFVPEDDFVALRQYRNLELDSSIEISVRSRTAWHEDGTVLGREEVGGKPATITENDYQRCLSWSPRHGLVFQVCDDLAGIDTTTATLVRVAQSIAPFP